MSLRDEVLADSPTIYLRLEETSGQHLDETTNDNDSTTVQVTGQGTADPGTGHAGSGLGDDFDGSDDHIVVPYSTDFYPGDLNSFTIFAVFQTDVVDATFRRIISWEDGSDGYSLHIHSASGGRLRLERSGGGNAKTAEWTGAIATDTVYMVHGVYDNDTDELRLYVDNVLEGTAASVTEQMADAGVALNLGRRVSDATRFFNGKLYEFAFFKSVLSTTRIQAHWDARDDAGDGGATVSLTGSGANAATGSGNVSLELPISGSGANAADGSGALGVTRDLSGAGANVADGTAEASFVRGLSGSGANASDGSGVLSTGVEVDLAGSGANASTGIGVLDLEIDLTGAGANANDGSGALTPTRGIAGSGANAAAGTGVLDLTVDLSGAGAAANIGSGDLTVSAEDVVALTGSGANASTGSGSVDLTRGLAGSGANVITGIGTLDLTVDLAGAGPAAMAGFGTLAAVRALSGTGANAATGSAVLGVGTPGFVRIESAVGSVALIESDSAVISLESAGYVEGV